MNLLKYIWPVLLGIYIISPFDAHPLFFDDLIAAAVLFYLIYKNSRQRSRFNQYGGSHSGRYSQNEPPSGKSGGMTLDEAYRIVGVGPDASWDEISKAYREKMSKSHPDKVSHLSEELRKTAEELTLRLNDALDLIRRHKGRR